MPRDLFLKSGLVLASAVAAVLTFSVAPAPVRAQGYDYDNDTSVGEVTVHPRVLGRDPATGAPIDTVTATRYVNVSDLDLDTNWGQRMAVRRVERAAYDACDYLDQHYVTLDSQSPDCVRAAVRDAVDQIETAVGHPIYYEG
jgi:UrcA family protein